MWLIFLTIFIVSSSLSTQSHAENGGRPYPQLKLTAKADRQTYRLGDLAFWRSEEKPLKYRVHVKIVP
jgi:hypothetical protein